MSFVIDGSDWDFTGQSSEEIAKVLDRLLDRLAVAAERREIVWTGDDLQTRHVRGELDFWSLWSPAAGLDLPNELRQEMCAFLGRAPRYLDEKHWPAGLTEATAVAIADDIPQERQDVAWAHHSVREGRAVACLGIRRAGAFTTHSVLGEAVVHWVNDEAGHRRFFRDAIDVERNTPVTLERLAPHAFPDLHFLDGIWGSLGDFDGDYERVRKNLRKLLSGLDDHGRWIFTAPPPALSPTDPPGPPGKSPGNQLIEQRFKQLVWEIAPENPNVFAKRNCREARERPLGNRTLYLEWHAKLDRHINRVHIHPPVPESADRVVVGIFANHLPLPGD